MRVMRFRIPLRLVVALCAIAAAIELMDAPRRPISSPPGTSVRAVKSPASIRFAVDMIARIGRVTTRCSCAVVCRCHRPVARSNR